MAGVADHAAHVIERHEGAAREQLVDLRVIWREWGDPNRKEPDPDAPIILDVGGRWDRAGGKFVGDGDTCIELHFQPAQYDAAYWFAGWLAEYLGGGVRLPKYDRKWTMLNVGGRRGGKTDFCVKAQVALCAARPDSIAWACSPTEDETIELHDVFVKLIPNEWAEYRAAELRWYFANGSVIEYRSGFKPKALKRGRVDLPFFNECQYFPRRSYNMVRGAIADRGGLVLAAANPPDEPIGQWLLEFYEQVKAGSETAVLFEFDNDLNPTVKRQAVDDMRHDIGEDDYRRDGKGEFIPIGDLVWYAWSPRFNVRPAGEIHARSRGVEPIPLENITRQFTKRHFGRAYDRIIGTDFQVIPHQAAAVCEFFRDPDDPNDALMWITDYVAIEGTEIDLAEELFSRGYDSETTAIVADASGDWQNSERTKGRGSHDMLRRAGYRWVFPPDRKNKNNPHIFERVQATNARMRNAAGKRRVFSVPENLEVNIALKSWENRNGVPNKRSDFAHLSDAVSYVVWRIWPRKSRRKRFKHEKVERGRSGREREFDDF